MPGCIKTKQVRFFQVKFDPRTSFVDVFFLVFNRSTVSFGGANGSKTLYVNRKHLEEYNEQPLTKQCKYLDK